MQMIDDRPNDSFILVFILIHTLILIFILILIFFILIRILFFFYIFILIKQIDLLLFLSSPQTVQEKGFYVANSIISLS